ncbi:GH36-type glycosyl hydrolase domain-containing protein [Snuella sedimenti]|uniref:Glycosyl hydrolase 94 catalytic domain-containing protein n=1 Tax=Snuella sedimenti TaxID=2798802 RepID=A0A8J7LXW4_9FLAO|nr:amylo-alpha-1,6-glucosidase [Snuella sedimenti]MBJ6367466.1 hypothetical protein [Snuella sedimenti]
MKGRLLLKTSTTRGSSLSFVILFFAIILNGNAQSIVIDDLAMDRKHIAPHAYQQLWIFNGRGKVYPRRYTLTGFNGFEFKHHIADYRFHFNFVDQKTGTVVRDNVHETIETHDPLGWNFRPGAPYVTVPQHETWFPYYYEKNGTFHKEIDGKWISFGILTKTYVSNKTDEVLMAITLENRADISLELILKPYQMGQEAFVVDTEQARMTVSSDLPERTEAGIKWVLPPKSTITKHFAIQATDLNEQAPAYFQPEIENKINEAIADANRQFNTIASKFPAFRSDNEKLMNLYKRVIGTMYLSRWERDDFIHDPYWQIGWFPLTVAWDFSFTADALAMVDPKIVETIVVDVLKYGKMESSYIGRNGEHAANILYIQDPFALQILIESYIKYTGDTSILDTKAGKYTVYEWMKQWANFINDNFRTSGPLINMGDANEMLIEIRTDGYDHIVPVVNGLAIDFYHTLAQWAKTREDKDSKKYDTWASAMNEAFHKELWNDKEGWFYNMYNDGSKDIIWTIHLFDLLGTPVLTPNERSKLSAHIKEGEFLGKYGMYSISPKDEVHWDVLDCDFGGGGFYMGSPLGIAKSLYAHNEPQRAWEIMKRIALLPDHFPFMPQSPRADEPFEIKTGGIMQISSGAALEAIWYGIFGIALHEDGSISVNPNYNKEIGESELRGFRYRGHLYDVILKPESYEVYKNNKFIIRNRYGVIAHNL